MTKKLGHYQDPCANCGHDIGDHVNTTCPWEVGDDNTTECDCEIVVESLTVIELIDKLSEFDPSTKVSTEGCDCFGAAVDVVAHNGRALVARYPAKEA